MMLHGLIGGARSRAFATEGMSDARPRGPHLPHTAGARRHCCRCRSIWWLLRFTPPKPQTVRFPPLRLLLDLVTREEQPDKTPWWLMLLRLALAALLILGGRRIRFYAPGPRRRRQPRAAAARRR